MATKSNVTKVKPPSYIIGLKQITNWFFSRNRKREEVEKIIEVYGIDNNIMKRFLLYCYNTPHLIYFINKYLNHLYDFNRFDTVNLLFSLTYLLDVNRITRKSIPEKLLYLKNMELADKNKNKIIELFDEYFTRLYDKDYNKTELNFLYDLVILNVITMDDIDKIDKHLNGKSSIKLEEITAISSPNSPKINNFVLDIYRELPIGIKEYCDQAKQFILSRPECKGCELFGKPTVIMDTNMEDSGEVDIIFFGLNPGTEECEIGKPFVGKAGKILRERMALIPAHLKWVITNVILCHTKNENDIKKPDDVKARCRDLVEVIRQTFPAKIIVPLGAKATDWFGIKGTMGNVSGKVFTSNNQNIIPIIHPSSANYNADNLSKFKKDFQSILNMFKSEESSVPVSTTISVPEVKQKIKYEEVIQTTGDKFITEVTPDLTFFDVREINDKILKIYIDQNGQKKYMVNDYKLHFYLKNASWKDCNQIADKVDAIVEITGREKGMAIKKIRDKLNQMKAAV